MATSSEDDEMVERRRQAKQAKKARKKEDGERSKKRKRAHKHGDREHKKDRKAKRHGKDAGDADDESGAEEDVQQQLERGRTAVRITRAVLERQPALKQELREVHSCQLHQDTCAVILNM